VPIFLQLHPLRQIKAVG